MVPPRTLSAPPEQPITDSYIRHPDEGEVKVGCSFSLYYNDPSFTLPQLGDAPLETTVQVPTAPPPMPGFMPMPVSISYQ